MPWVSALLIGAGLPARERPEGAFSGAPVGEPSETRFGLAERVLDGLILRAFGFDFGRGFGASLLRRHLFYLILRALASVELYTSYPYSLSESRFGVFVHN